MKQFTRLVGVLLLAAAASSPAFAQQAAAGPDRTVLPIPDPKFGGAVGRTIDKSKGDWSILSGVKAPAGAPNVLIVLIDDAGFGGPDTFGGAIHTPNLTRIADAGLTYNRFHVTAVCSPTRAALLTGRNHHRVGMGMIAEFPAPFPGYTGVKPKSTAAVPRILKDNGYATAGFGKWHMTPGHEMGAAGPFEHWPTGWGFDHWWGFLTGAAGGSVEPLMATSGDPRLSVVALCGIMGCGFSRARRGRSWRTAWVPAARAGICRSIGATTSAISADT